MAIFSQMRQNPMETIVFRQWSNRKYAVLASFHKIIIIGTLSFGCNLLAQHVDTGQLDSSHVQMHVELEEVEAVAGELIELEGITLKPVSSISAKDISSSPATSMEDVLQYLPQVDIRNRGKHGTQADLTIQGGTFDQSLILLNGINLADPQTGHFHLNLPVDITAIQRVEVLTGPATRIFGTNALTGVVNLISQPADSTYISSGLRYGQYQFYKAFLKSNISGKYVKTVASVSTSGSDGYINNTDFWNIHAFIHTVATKDYLTAHLMVGLNTRKFGANSFYTPLFPNQYEETTTGLTALRIDLYRPIPLINLNLYWRTNQDHFLLDRFDPGFYQNNHMTHVIGADLNGKISTGAGLTATGLHFRSERIFSTTLGEQLEVPRTSLVNDQVEYTHGHIRNHVNLIINHTMEWRAFSIAGGTMVHLDSDNSMRPSVFPGLDLSLRLPVHFTLYATINRSMRLPTFTDLYYQGPTNVGNPDLLAEKATIFEMGISREWNTLHFDLNGFYRQGREMIDWVWMDDSKWHTLNLTEIDAVGADVHLFLKPEGLYKGNGFIKKWGISYTFNHVTSVSEDVISRYLLDNLRHKIVMEMDHRVAGNLMMTWRIMYQNRDGSYMAFQSETATFTETPYEPFLLMDVKLKYVRKRFVIFIESTNLFDIDYYDLGNVRQPGRWLIAGIEIQ